MNDQIKRECPACGKVYDADPTRLKFGRQTSCSRACSYQLRAAALKNGEKHQCGGCGKDVYRSPAQLKGRHGLVFCSAKCGYSNRKRVVNKPYVRTAVVDYVAAAKKTWETRRRNAKPYPEAAREKARARAIQRLQNGRGVSAFEKKAAEVFRSIGFDVRTSVPVRSAIGTFAHVFDIVLPRRRIVIECHGSYFHGGRWTWLDPDHTQAKNLAYEERKLATARRLGLDLRILWEHEFKKDPTGACLAVVA